MPFCPNPDCPHRKRLDEPAEFRKGITICSDCGTTLSETAPIFEPTRVKKIDLGWTCPECGTVNPEGMSKCVCGYDDNRPFNRSVRQITEPTISHLSKRIENYSAVIKKAIFYSIINFLAANFLFTFLPFNLGGVLFNIGRAVITFYAGWLAAENKVGGLWKSAATGAVVYAVDHIILKGGMFLIMYSLDPKEQGLMAFFGVLVSYIMFLPMFLIVGLLGGLYAKARRKKRATDIT